MQQAVDEALAADRSSRSREMNVVCFKIATYERAEFLSLVELFLWKIKIGEASSKERNADRQSCLINSGASFVIFNVLPFLDKLDKEDYSALSPLIECNLRALICPILLNATISSEDPFS
eukprot:scaffold3105_cov89-Cylindrotheca_fusiformis.AAC.3